MSQSTESEIRVGPAGWSYADWNGIVYPAQRPRAFHEAGYLARFFDAIEINTTFYHPPRPEMARSWVQRVAHNPRFRFTAKLWQRFTHDRNASREDEKAMKQGLEPLAAAGRLGALLVQFPWSFKNTTENREYLGGVCMEFMEYPLVVEVRHSSWNRPEIFEMLGGLGAGFANIDQPLIGKSLAPSDRATSRVGYVRLHGRNYRHWFTSEETAAERYDYLYSLNELEPWVERIRNVAARSETTYVIANNHFEGKAVANSLELESLLSGKLVAVPPTMVERYPELRSIQAPGQAAGSDAAGPQQSDFAFGVSK